MPKNQIDYTKVFIYKICCNNISIKDIYIGHTTNFEQRKNSHKRSCEIDKKNTRVYKFIRENGGWSNWSMILIENYSCNNRHEAEMRERYWIENQKATLNCNNPITTKEEKEKQKQDWYEENKEDILQKKKENYEENKEQILEKIKKYTEENKEKIKEYQEEYQKVNKDKLNEQKKIYRSEHKEEAIKAQKEWREVNKEKIKAEKSIIINCECGNQYTFGNKHRHLQSKFHIDYQNQLCDIIKEPETITTPEEKSELLKQKQKEYRDKNSEKIKEFKKKYNESHKDNIKEQTHKYYDEHKSEIIEKNKKYVEENKEKVKKNKDEWYQKNKEKILAKQKEIFTCECGSEVRCAGKAEHNRSVKHKNYMESNLNTENNLIEEI